ncbi:MAG: hypothetical protein JWP89_3161 [Schlesneria sp.]|nr:hypothetical protein [Schlesneria sp.]
MSKKSHVAACRMLRQQDEEFWAGVQVFPSVIRRGAGVKDYNAQTLTQLRKCGANNLRLLAARTAVLYPKGTSSDQIASRLCSSDTHSTLTYLAEFVRNKGLAINEEYDSHFSASDRRKHSAELDEVTKGRGGGLKQFVKLLLLYESQEETVRRIFVRRLWRSKRTACQFSAPAIIKPRSVEKIGDEIGTLTSELSNALSGFELRYFTTVVLGPWTVLLLQREYAPVVRPDYRDTQKTLHGFGWIMLGVEQGGRRIQVKGGGKKTFPIIESWFRKAIGIDVVDTESDVFANYDPSNVENSLLGGYHDSCPVHLTAMSFKRTLTPQHSPMIVEAPFPGQDIRRDLLFGKEHKIFRIRSLTDLNWFRLRRGDKEVRVDIVPDPGGAVTLRLDNTDVSEDEIDKLREEFATHFAVPLDRRIDPQHLALGVVDVYNFLLEIDRTDGLAQYQRKALQGLIDKKIVSVEVSEVLVCPRLSHFCKYGGQDVTDPDLAECPGCQTELQKKKIELIKHGENEIRKVVAKLLESATNWTFSSSAVQFEGQKFYALSDPNRPDRIIRVYFAKRVGERILQCLDRSLQPVFVVHTGGDVEHAHLDAAGVAHISFARALAASVDADVASRFDEDVKYAREDLMRRQEGKVHSRAADSRKRIENPPDGYSGEAYQLDVFNILRSVCPYTEYWTGANRPDGFCSLVSFKDANLRNPIKHNWSYDAKFTREPSYDLGVSEERKAWDYIAALAEQPELSAQGDELNGHAIISNRLSADQMKGFAKFMRREHRLGRDQSNIKVIFMIDGFLLRLYDRVREDEMKFRKRGNWLSLQLTTMMNKENSEGYVLLDSASAHELCSWVVRQKEIETPPNTLNLRDGLSDTMTKS